MSTIFDYQDYRAFLAEYYANKKAADPAFSYQNFSRAAGFASKSFVFNVINGRKNLSRSSVVRMCEAMKLSKSESTYFETLVYFNQAGNFAERNLYFDRLNSIHPASAEAGDVHKLRKDQYDFYATWYHAVVRSLIDLYPKLSANYARLAGMVSPPITPKQAKKSVELLERLGLITKQKGGIYKITDKRLTSGEEVQCMGVQKFHIETMKLAEKAIKELPKDTRNISGLTLGISQKSYEEIIDLIYDCQKKIMDVADKDEKSDRVYQVNFHAFPLSKM